MRLTGVEAIWRDANGKEQWSGWLPHLDLAVAALRRCQRGARTSLRAFLKKPGVLQLRTQLISGNVARRHPAGSKTRFEYPPEMVTVTSKPSGGLKLHTSSAAKVDDVTA